MKTCNYNFEFGDSVSFAKFMIINKINTMNVLEVNGDRFACSPDGAVSILMATTVEGLSGRNINVVEVTNKNFRRYPEKFMLVVLAPRAKSPKAQSYTLSNVERGLQDLADRMEADSEAREHSLEYLSYLMS